MIATHFETRPGKADVAIYLVADAWAQLCRSKGQQPTTPIAVVPIKRQKTAERKSGVYLMKGVGENGAPVIAKRCRRETGAIERVVYEHILPHASVPSLRYYGWAEDREEAFCWLFLEEVGAAEITAADRPLTGEWLARLHTSAAPIADQIQLPDRGPEHYLEHLRVARDTLGTLASYSPLTDDERQVVQMVRRLTEEVESHWNRMCAACATAPRTLVHGDFIQKNIRFSADPGGPKLVALDWETAGWGPPAVDLHARPYKVRGSPTARAFSEESPEATLFLDVYAAAVRATWPDLTKDAVRRLSRVGTMFRVVAGVRWAADMVRGGGEHSGMKRLRQYVEDIPRAMAVLLSQETGKAQSA